MKKRPTVNKKHSAEPAGSSMARHKKSRKKPALLFFIISYKY